MAEENYIHGYSASEQERLVRQARFLGPAVFHNVDFSDQENLLEVGCGVGAETELLFEHFPHLKKITGVDRETRQVQVAVDRLKDQVAAGRFEALVAEATKLPFASGSFEGAFVCWILEHTADPFAVLRECLRVLEPGGVLHLIEVQHDSFQTFPESNIIQTAWDTFGVNQIQLGGDPFVGAKLMDWLRELGFKNVRKFPGVLDSREYPKPLSTDLWDYFLELIETSYGTAATSPTSHDPQILRDEFEKMKKTEKSFLRYTFASVVGEKPAGSA